MSRRVCRNCSGRATAGSYSTSACSCVRLTATLSTPGNRPSAFSIVPVQSEQWRPPMRARIFRRFALADGSSLHGVKPEAVCVATFIAFSMRRLPRRLHCHTGLAGAFARRLAADDPKTRLLNYVHKMVFLNRPRVIKHASQPFAERHGRHPHARLFFDETLDGVRARIAVHAFNSEDRCFHPILRSTQIQATEIQPY